MAGPWYQHEGVDFDTIFQRTEGAPFVRIPFGDTGFMIDGTDLADMYVGVDDGGNTNLGGGVSKPVDYVLGYMTYMNTVFSGPITENPDVNIFYSNTWRTDKHYWGDGDAQCEVQFARNGRIYYWDGRFANGTPSGSTTPDNVSSGHKWVNSDKHLFGLRFRIQITSITGTAGGTYFLSSSIPNSPSWIDMSNDHYVSMWAPMHPSQSPITQNGGTQYVNIRIEEIGKSSNYGTIQLRFDVSASNQFPR